MNTYQETSSLPVESGEIVEIDLGDGNNTVFTATDHASKTLYKGGAGLDTLNVVLTPAQLEALTNADQLAALKSYLRNPAEQVLDLSLLNFSAEGFESAVLYIRSASDESGDRLLAISTEALLKTQDTVVGSSDAEPEPPVEEEFLTTAAEGDLRQASVVAAEPEASTLKAIASIPQSPALDPAIADNASNSAPPSPALDPAIADNVPKSTETATVPTLVSQPNVSTLFVALDEAYVVSASNADDFVYTGAFGDLIYTGVAGSSDQDQVWAGDGNDTIVLSGGIDRVSGEAGDDLFLINVPEFADGDLNGDLIIGGAGVDTLRSDTSGAPILLSQVNNPFRADSSTFTDIEVFDGNGGTVVGRTSDINYLNFSAFNSVVDVPLILLGNSYDFVDASTFAAGVEVRALAGNDLLVGSSGNDTLVGGLGDDTLTGNAGQDFFQLNAPGQGVDFITSFTPGVDKLQLVMSEYGNFQNPGTLLASRFAIGAATTSNQKIIYNPLTGNLLYDVDGSGSTAAVQIALLQSNLSISASDIVMVSV